MSLPELIVEVAFRTDPDATIPEWDDISEYVREVTIRRGRQHELEVVQAGTCSLVLNNGARQFDPTYTASPFYPYVLPMRKIRVGAVWNSTTHYLFTGYVERWPIVKEAPAWSSVRVTATDGMAALSQADIAGTFPEELSGARVDRVLAAAAWPESTPAAGYWTLGTSTLGTGTVLSYGIPETVLDDGLIVIPETVIAEGAGTSALAHIQLVAQSERGVFFIDGQGRAVFQDHASRYGADPLFAFVDDPATIDADRIKYQDVLPEFDVEKVANEVIVTREGGTAQTATDDASITQYLRRSLSLNLLLVSDVDAADRAAYEVALRHEPRLEFTSLTAMPQAQDDAWPHLLALELSDMVTVEWAPDTIADLPAETIERDVFVESIAHAATPSGWTVTVQLSPGDIFGQFFELGVAELGSDASAVLAY